jgi:hypothetical protein
MHLNINLKKKKKRNYLGEFEILNEIKKIRDIINVVGSRAKFVGVYF